MQRELAASGLSPEEILAKTLLLQKAMAGDNSPAFINKTLKNALNVANLNKEDLVKVRNPVIVFCIYFLDSHILSFIVSLNFPIIRQN